MSGARVDVVTLDAQTFARLAGRERVRRARIGTAPPPLKRARPTRRL